MIFATKYQISQWLHDCIENLTSFKENRLNQSRESNLLYIRQQYQLIYVLIKVSKGQTKLVGVNRDQLLKNRNKLD